MNAVVDDEIRLKLLKLLKEDPRLTQREMNQRMGVSLGKINYCISSLSREGMIRIEQFKNTSNKTGYLYRITPKGLTELTQLMLKFLRHKVSEFDRIKKEIKKLAEQVKQMDPDLCDESALLVELKKII